MHSIDAPFAVEVERYPRNLRTKISHQEPSDARYLRGDFSFPPALDVSPNGLLLLSDYSDEQEGEADWLAAALLVPREGLMRLRRPR